MHENKSKKDGPSKKRRKNKAKSLRLERARKMNELRKDVKRNKSDTNIVLMRGDEELVIAVRRGLFGHDCSPILRVTADEIVGAVEDVKELGGIATKVGVMVLAQLTGHHLSYGAEGLAKALASFAQIDLEALAKEAANGTDGGGPSELPASLADDVGEPGGSGSGSAPATSDSATEAPATERGHS
jgi:hypothetical protein